MPQAIAPVLAAAGVSGGIAIGTEVISFATIGAYAILFGGTVGGGILLKTLDKGARHAQPWTTIRQSITPRVRGYGRVKMSGAMFYMGANRTLIQGIAFCEGEIDGYEEVWLNDKICPYTPGSFFTFGGWSWGFNVTIDLRLGTPWQSVAGAWARAGHYWWDYTHYNSGLAYATLSCGLPFQAEKNFSKVYQSGVPAVRVVARLLKIYDPRTGLTAWSQNPALCVYDYLTSSRGFNIPAANLNTSSFITAANLCDESVVILASPFTEKRYSFNGVYTLDEEPRVVLRRLLASCDGEIVQLPDGKIGLRGGKWDPPTFTITDSMVLSYEIQQGNDKLAAFNQLRIRYRDMSFYGDYQIVEGLQWDDVAAQNLSGEVLPRDFDCTPCSSASQARRLAKIAMFKGNPQWIITLNTNLAALNALGDRTVQLVLDDLGINASFFVMKFEIAGDLKGCALQLSSLDSKAYEWNASEEGYSPNYTNSDQQFKIPIPTGLVLTFEGTLVSLGVTPLRIVASVTPPFDTSLGLVCQISGDGRLTWTDMSDGGGFSDFAQISNQTRINKTYSVRAAFTFGKNARGEYSEPVDIFVPAATGLGPVAISLLAGVDQDYDLASLTFTSNDDFGFASSAPSNTVDLGNCFVFVPATMKAVFDLSVGILPMLA